MCVQVVHPSAGTIPKQNIREMLAKIYKVNDIGRIIVCNFTTAFGGGVSHGLGCIYDTQAAAKKFERNYQLARLGIEEVKTAAVSRRAKKDIRTRRRKVRGTAKAKVAGGKK